MRWLLAIVSMLVSGCRYTGTYACERDEECRSSAAPGTCQLPAGVCSFPDLTCPLGQRYDDTAGDLAGECVESAIMIDAPILFDPSVCPSGFSQAMPGILSRYRVLPALPSTARFADYMAACDAQLAGKTHAAVFDTKAEATAVLAAIGVGAGRYYIGVVQDAAALTPAVGWIHADGTAVASGLWAGTEPNDGNGSEADHLEQAGVVVNDGTFNDISGTMAAPVICECDGSAPSATFQAFVLSTRD